MAYKFLMTAPTLGAAGQQVLSEAGCHVDYLTGSLDAQEVEQRMATTAYDAVISRTVTLSEQAIAACPSLKVICKHGVGVTNIDVAAATARGIPVLTTPATNAQSVAELTIGLMLAASRHLYYFQQEILQGRWTRSSLGGELFNKRLGLVGFGEIGQRVAHVAQAIGMSVSFFDPGLAATVEHPGIARLTDINDLFAVSDVLSLHCPVNKATQNLLNQQSLSQLPENAVVINTSRGELIDEEAFIAALRSGAIAAAGLDTFAVEPLRPDHPFRTFDNVILTPHIGGSTQAALDAVAHSAAQQCLTYLAEQHFAARACVNPDFQQNKELAS
ncbi:hydroxyacid dehydrogenase [Tatumella sp. TA1]|nr:hydroxyacid dehydrogenase [Tatumella sp. TA1]